MGLFKKVKEILFDEEEDFTEQIKITPEMRNEEIPMREEKTVEPPVKEVKETPVKEPEKPVVSERELFKTDSSFPFFDFDVEEFDKQKPVVKAPERPVVEKRNTNVFEYERRKKVEKRTDYGRYERTEVTETVERKKFKPSPIISPVYGILNQDYNKNDILKRESDKVDIQTVRDKAFGEKKASPVVEPNVTFYEETETVTISQPEEKEKKVKTIDELLEGTSDIVVDIDRDLDNDLDVTDNIEYNTEPVEDSMEVTKELETPVENKDEDTLENDLFDLIDSMYNSKEDGE